MSIKRRKFSLGIRLKGSTQTTTLEGELRLDPSAFKFKAYVDGDERSLVTEDQAQTLTNKTIDVDNNTVSNIEVDNLKAGVLNTDLSGAATDDELPSALAVKTALEGQNEAAEIAFDPSGSSLTATNVKGALDEVAGRLDTNETDITELEANQADLVTLSGVPENSTNLGTFTGTTISDSVDNKVALQELETSLELKANSDGATITNATIQTSSIETPTRSDIKQDTLANLETYASTATNGQLVFATDEKKTFQIVDNELIAVGGAQTVKLTAGEDLVLGEAVYISTGTGDDAARNAGELYKVEISSDDRIEVLGIVIKPALATEEAEVQFAGELKGLSGLTAGKVSFASETAGQLTETAPSSSNIWIITLGLATSATSLIINPVASASATYVDEAQESFVIANNQSSAQNVTGLLVDPLQTRSFSMNYEIYRKTDDALSEVVEVGTFRAVYNSQAGSYLTSQDFAGNETGVELSIQPSGQIQYTSTDISGANYVGTLQYKITNSFGV